MNGEDSNLQALNVPNRDANNGKTSISIGDKKLSMAHFCFKCDGHGHYAIVCPTKGLHLCVEEPEFELENYPKKRRPTMKMNLVKNVITIMV